MPQTTNITLSQLQQMIKETLNDSFQGGVWIVAEINELKANPSSGHCYLELVEKGGANGIPKAKASATIWRHVYGMLSAYFTGATGEQLAAGMKVLMKVSVVYHELYGLSLNVTDIDPLYTLGDLERQRQQTIEQLRDDGVFDLNRELTLALVPQRLAVVSSAGAAGYQDFMNELTAAGYRFEVRLFEAVMQGHAAEESIIGALGRIAEEADAFDAVVIIRGGGSQSDLSFLNSYMINFHVAQFPIPVIAGLGHDKDQSILDMVAYLSLKTPTAVAGFLVQKAAELDGDLDMMASRVEALAKGILAGQREYLQRVALGLSKGSASLGRRVEARLQSLRWEVLRRQEAYLARQRSKLDAMSALLAERSGAALRGASMKIEGAQRSIAGRDPQSIMALGFAVVRHQGKAVRDAAMVKPGDTLQITLHKGTITTKTEHIDE